MLVFDHIFWQNKLINECARKNLAKISKSHSPVVLLYDVEELTFLKGQSLFDGCQINLH